MLRMDFVKELASGTRVATAAVVVGDCSFGNMVEASGSAATEDCSNRSQP
jgi:hypothetical protein